MEKVAIWNNKGGIGKTSLSFQLICEYALQYPEKRILAVDVCPQANLSELLLGGLNHGGGDNLIKRQGAVPRATIGGYFQLRLSVPYSPIRVVANAFLTKPNTYNTAAPDNVDLLCGDSLLELQSNAIFTLANTQISEKNTWIAIIDWLSDFVRELEDEYDIMFLDVNSGFSIYTQIALATAEKLILPVMADNSSRRALQNVFSLVYGVKLPSEVYTKYVFAEKLKEESRTLPKVHLILKNRMREPASAYATVLEAIDRDLEELLRSHPAIFTFENLDEGIVTVRDFRGTGVVSSARGCPFPLLSPGRLDVLGKRVQVKEEIRSNCVKRFQEIVAKI